MMTGMHTVADVFCVGCGSVVGWVYVRNEAPAHGLKAPPRSSPCLLTGSCPQIAGARPREEPEVQGREVRP